MNDDAALTPDELLAWFEGALAPEAAAALAARLAADPAARALVADWQAQNAALAALHDPIAREPVPERLTAVIRRAEVRHRPRAALQVAAALAVLALGAAGGWFAHGLSGGGPQGETLSAAAIRAHDTYVVEVVHPVEVAASDAAHLNAWMSKRLGHETRPPDFAAAGFTLLGGRIVPSDAGAAALYMYENADGQRVTLYIAPQGAARTTAFQFAEQGGTQSFFWMDRDLSYAVVGDIPRETLRKIALAAYDQLI